jgi:hypothetical protein
VIRACRAGNRGGVGVGGWARARFAEAGNREVGDGGGSLHWTLNS